ncbi:hypothetical protein BG015_006836 [Linnemannia schmuckeri]|uniref:NAD-dependent epimerase/dehydratase domain-containing protein n=1 Tax=Linnemannia schmuckeri TaxID=64567 RepID=A0A9P5RZN6_9FUNG|nr:hypothetical protein BG015_006836 [Linnemannia schmuckeri]
MSTHDALHSFDIHNDLLGRNSPPSQHPDQHCISNDNNNNNNKSTKRILLTGGAGFIGSVLVRKLVLNYPEYLIVVVDKLDYCSSLNNLRPFLVLLNENGEEIDQDTIHSSQDTPSFSSPSSTTTATTTTTEIPWSQSSDTLNPSEDTNEFDPRKGNTRSNPLYPNFVFLEGDITDVEFIESTMVEYRINTILHLAAQTHVDKSFGQSIEFTQNNVLGTHVLLEAARKYFVPLSPSRKAKVTGKSEQDQEQEGGDEVENRFVFVSTDEVYGECRLGQPDCREDGLLAPSNPYSATKAAAECMVQAYHKSFKIPIIITRSNNVYGPFQYPEKIFPKFIMHLLYPDSYKSRSGSAEGQGGGDEVSKGHCYIHGSGQHSRTYLYVADAANALDVILHRGLVGEVYNIGAGHELSNIELAQNLIHRLVIEPLHLPSPLHSSNGYVRNGRGSNGYVQEPDSSVIMRQEKANLHQGECRTCIDRIVFVEDRAFNDQRYAVDSTKLVGLGWSPQVDYEQGIVNTTQGLATTGTSPIIPTGPPPPMVERYSSIPAHPVLDPEEQHNHLTMDNYNNNNNAPDTSLQHQQQGQQGQQQQQQQQQAHQPPQQQRKTNQKTSLRPLPPVYKIQLHLRKGEPLERRRLTHGLPDPEPYDHVQGQDSYIILRERIAARVARHSDLFWPEDGTPYIKPAESVPQKYYQQMTEENFEDQMAKAWRQEAKRLPDEGLIVLNVFVYLKECEPKEPGAPGRPPGRGTAAAGGAATAGAAASATGHAPGAPRGPRTRLRLTDGTAATAAGPGAGTEVGAVRPRPLNIPGGTAPVPRPGPPPGGAGLLPPRPPGAPGTGRPGRPPLPPHLRRRPPPPGSHAAGGVGPGGGPGPIRRGPGRPPGRPLFRPPPPGMQGPRVRPSAVDQAIRNKVPTPGEAVVAAINSPIVTSAASPSSLSTSTLTIAAAAAALSGVSTSFSTSSSSSSAIPANIPLNPNLVSVPLPPLATRTQAPRAASASARQQHQHRLSAIPQIHPPPSPPAAAPAVDQDHEMEDVGNNNHNDIDDLMQDDFDQPGLEELPPQRTYTIHAPPSPSPPPAATSSSSAASSSSSVHTYSVRPHPLGLQPQHQAQTAQAGQAAAAAGGGGNDGDFKTINVKINGLVVPIMFDIKSLREAIFS